MDSTPSILLKTPPLHEPFIETCIPCFYCFCFSHMLFLESKNGIRTRCCINEFIFIVVSAASTSETIPFTVIILSVYFLLAALSSFSKFTYEFNRIHRVIRLHLFCIRKFFRGHIPVNTNQCNKSNKRLRPGVFSSRIFF